MVDIPHIYILYIHTHRIIPFESFILKHFSPLVDGYNIIKTPVFPLEYSRLSVELWRELRSYGYKELLGVSQPHECISKAFP